MIKEYVSGKSAEDIVFKKDRISIVTFDFNSEVLSISVTPRLVLAHGEEREQASISHNLTSIEPQQAGVIPINYFNAMQVPETAIDEFNTLKTEIANKVAKFYENHILTIENQ